MGGKGEGGGGCGLVPAKRRERGEGGVWREGEKMGVWREGRD